MGHNEDGDTIDITTGYIIEAQIMEESGRTEEFYAFCYAGDLCGKAFGYNGKGVVTTVNALFPKHVNTSAMGKYSSYSASSYKKSIAWSQAIIKLYYGA